MRSASALGLFAFLSLRTLENLVRAKLRRLKEPRYLVGLILGLGYLATVLLPRSHRPPRGGPGGHGLEAGLPVFLAAAAVGLTAFVLLSWIFRKGSPALLLSEPDIQFLFPAPISRRAVLHYSLIRPQLGLIFGSLVTTLLVRAPGLDPGRLRTLAGTWIVLSVFHLHFLALGFTKAAWSEKPPLWRRLLSWGVPAAAALAFLVLASEVASAVARVGSELSRGRVSSMAALARAVDGPFAGRALPVLLAPARALLGPLLAPDGRHFFAALPAALAVLLLHYAWVARSSVRYEDATFEHAARRARLRALRSSGRAGGLAPERKRRVVPFPLAATGPPEVGIVWKNLLALGRFRIRTAIALVLSGAALLFGGAALLARSPDLRGLTVPVALLAAGLLVMIAAMLPYSLRNDLRGDLEHAAELRTWPLSPRRLVAGELLGPLTLSTLILWSGLLLALATAAGNAVGSRLLGIAARPGEALAARGVAEGALALPQLVSIAVGLGLFLPALTAVALVVQNATVLAFPAWFPPGRRRAVGLEASGLRILSFAATTVLLALGLLPAALLTVPLFLFGRGLLGAATFAVAGGLAAVPLALEAAAGVGFLALLLQRFDPADEGR